MKATIATTIMAKKTAAISTATAFTANPLGLVRRARAFLAR
jgi:hypothetical protein